MEIKKIINEVFKSLEGNNFKVLGEPDIPIWEEPLVGVSKGNDDYYKLLKEHIGEFHLNPEEVFALKYDKVAPEDLSVVSILFPQVEKTREEQRKATKFPADHWVISRGEWEPLMRAFSEKLIEKLKEEGILAVSTDLQKEITWHNSENVGLASNWSHRHAAFASGLGTFGLSGGFISEKGKANRITTIVVKDQIEVTPRGDRGLYDWCLYYAKGICGSCIRRCPTRAISEKGHNKERCEKYENDIEERLWPEHLEKGDYMFGCGICQTKVPCEYKKP